MSKEREFFQRIVDWYDDDAENVAKFVEEIRAYLAEPEQDEGPVAWTCQDELNALGTDVTCYMYAEPLVGENNIPLYLHPAQRPELVRLSEEEIFNLYNEHEEETSVHSTIFHFNEFARAIEARVLQREPLKKEQIEKGFQETGYREGESRGRCFVLGVRFAEKHHGIGGGDE